MTASSLPSLCRADLRRLEAAEAAAARAQAMALRLQLDAHFLFNMLNSVSSLVATGRSHDAEQMIGKTADFLRALLHTDPLAEVAVAQEIDMIDTYLAIEAARFGDRLQIDYAIAPDAARARVPNFILQPLVENAVKYGVARSRGPASIRISAARRGKDIELAVLSGPPGDVEPAGERSCPGLGLGLENVRRRLAARYGGRASLEIGMQVGHHHATIRLPLRR